MLALYARSAVVDREHYADRAVQTLAQDEVADEIAARFATGVIERSPGLVTLRPALETAASEVAASPWFAVGFATGVRNMHRRVFASSDPRPSLRVPGMAAQVQAALARRTPVLALRLPRDSDPTLMAIGGSKRERMLLEAAARADGVSRLAPLVLILGLLGLSLAALSARDRRRGVWASGLALAGAGGALLAGWIGARTVTLEGFDTGWGDAVVKTIWGAYLGDLRTWSLALAGAGIVVAALAARPEQRERVSWSRVPAASRGAALVMAGAVTLADHDLALDLAAVAAAGVLLYLGALQLLAGRARIALAGIALLAMTVSVAVAAHGPDPAPPEAAAGERTGAVKTGAVVQGSTARVRSAPAPPSGSPRICFASRQDARAAAEGAAIPEGAVVKELSDGRVCVRDG